MEDYSLTALRIFIVFCFLKRKIVCTVPEKTAGCQSNDDCPYSDSCINQLCIDPCAVRNPCALNAECQSANHKANCKCPPGLNGDPFSNCYKGIFGLIFGESIK